MKKLLFSTGLFVDELDLFILKNIFLAYQEKKERNTWEMAKEFLSKKLSKDIFSIYQTNKIDVDNLYRDIMRKLNKYKNFGILRVVRNRDGRDIFELDLDKITVAKHRFSDGFHECLLIRT